MPGCLVGQREVDSDAEVVRMASTKILRTSLMPPRSRRAWSKDVRSASVINRNESTKLLLPAPLCPTRKVSALSSTSQFLMLR